LSIVVRLDDRRWTDDVGRLSFEIDIDGGVAWEAAAPHADTGALSNREWAEDKKRLGRDRGLHHARGGSCPRAGASRVDGNIALTARTYDHPRYDGQEDDQSGDTGGQSSTGHTPVFGLAAQPRTRPVLRHAGP